jgi:hypothetical protein
MNKWLMMNLDSFLQEQCPNVDLFGQCFSKCRKFLDFLDFLDKNKTDLFQVKRVDANTSIVAHQDSECVIKIIDAICFFDNMNDFQQHALIMADKLEYDNSKVPVQCFKVNGLKFTYFSNNVYVEDTIQQYEAVGFQHWVLLVDKKNERYVLDPTIKQFHKPPDVLLLNMSSQNGLTPTIPNARKV